MEQFTTTIRSAQSIDEFRAEALPELLARLGTWGYRVTAQTENMASLTRERGGCWFILFRMTHTLVLSYHADGDETRLIVNGNHGKVRELLDELAS
jgi:hypothetical protein